MAILRSVSGRFYDIPDAQLENFAVPPEKVKQAIAVMEPEAEVEPFHRRRRRHRHYWSNYWANCWRNCWRNCY